MYFSTSHQTSIYCMMYYSTSHRQPVYHAIYSYEPKKRPITSALTVYRPRLMLITLQIYMFNFKLVIYLSMLGWVGHTVIIGQVLVLNWTCPELQLDMSLAKYKFIFPLHHGHSREVTECWVLTYCDFVTRIFSGLVIRYIQTCRQSN